MGLGGGRYHWIGKYHVKITLFVKIYFLLKLNLLFISGVCVCCGYKKLRSIFIFH